MVAGLSQRQAYIEAAYATKGKSDAYIDTEACRLFKNPKVFQRYQELMEEHKAKALWTREDAVGRLKWLIDQSIISIRDIDEGYVRQGTSNALLGAIKELNEIEGIGEERETKINLDKARIEKIKAETNITEEDTQEGRVADLLKGVIDVYKETE